MIAVPPLTPVTTPLLFTVVIPVLLLLQVPPLVVLASVVLLPTHTLAAPVISGTTGVALTVTAFEVTLPHPPKVLITAV